MRVSLSYGSFTGHHARDPTEDQDGRDLHDAESLQTSYTGKVVNDPVNVRAGLRRWRVLQLLPGTCDFPGISRNEGQHLSEWIYDGIRAGRQFLQTAVLVQYLSAWLSHWVFTQDITIPGEKGYGILHRVWGML